MCKVERRFSLLCCHLSDYTDKCLQKKYEKNIWSRVFSACKIKFSEDQYYEICHTCRRFFEALGISKLDALRQYIDYRQEHNYYGPLSPHIYKSDKPPVLMRDGELELSSRQQWHPYSERTAGTMCGCLLCLSPKQNQPTEAKGGDDSQRSSLNASTSNFWPYSLSTIPLKTSESFASARRFRVSKHKQNRWLKRNNQYRFEMEPGTCPDERNQSLIVNNVRHSQALTQWCGFAWLCREFWPQWQMAKYVFK